MRSERLKLFESYPDLIRWSQGVWDGVHSFSRSQVIRTAIRVGLDVIEASTKKIAAEKAEAKKGGE